MTTPTPPTAALDLAAIRERADAATPGPWTHVGRNWFRTATPISYLVHTNEGQGAWRVEDVMFMAAARIDVPALLDEVERLREELSSVWALADQRGDQARELIVERDEAWAAAKAERDLRVGADDLLLSAIAEAVGFRRERDELRDALAAALKADAVQAGYASGWDDARRGLQATIETGEAEDWGEDILQPLRDVFEDLARDESWTDLGQWLDLVWKQAFDDRDAAWTALNALGIDPRQPDGGVAKVCAVVEAAKAWSRAIEECQSEDMRAAETALIAAVDTLPPDTP